jgi:hypothetical protein
MFMTRVKKEEERGRKRSGAEIKSRNMRNAEHVTCIHTFLGKPEGMEYLGTPRPSEMTLNESRWL